MVFAMMTLTSSPYISKLASAHTKHSVSEEDHENMSISRWTALPAELREQIYAYVLTEPSGLTYRTGTDGLNRICAREKQVIHVNKFGSHLAALTHYLYYNVLAVSPRVTIAPEELEFNQIQYVSRQCYQEAHSLEFRYNNVLFEDGRHMSAGQRCRMFVNKVMKQHFAQYLDLSIRGSVISFQPSGLNGSPVTLAQFCLQHPKASLRLHHPFWSQRRPGFLLLGLAYAAAIRGHGLLERLVREHGPMLDFDLTLIRSMLPKEGVPLNFRLAPWEESLDITTMRESLEDCLFSKSDKSVLWLDLVQDWFFKGL